MKKYEQAAAWMEEKIITENMQSGDRMPGEMEMAAALGFSRQTIRQAVGVLERRGLLTSRQGSGIYVTSGDILETVQGRSSSAEKATGGTALVASGDVRSGKTQKTHLPSPGKRFGNVTIISTYLDDYIFPGTVRGMQNVLAEHGYAARIELTNNRVMTERSILQHLLEMNETDGLIVEAVKSALPNPNLDLYRQLREKGVRIVFFNSFYPQLEYPCVRIDDVQCARDAVKLLLNAGRERIAGIFKSEDGQGCLRYQGYLQALIEAGITVDEARILWISSNRYRLFDLLETDVFAFLEQADGVLCYNDELACSLIERAPHYDRRIPEDLSVVSIDDSYLAQMTSVPVTSFSHPKEALGRAAAEKLVRMIELDAAETDLILQAVPTLRASV